MEGWGLSIACSKQENCLHECRNLVCKLSLKGMFESAMQIPCENHLSVDYAVPYLVYCNITSRNPIITVHEKYNTIRFWLHNGLLIFGLLIAILNFLVQHHTPLAYGKHTPLKVTCPLNSRFSTLLTHFFPGLVLFTVMYFLSGSNLLGVTNMVLYSLFSVHYLFRGLIAPMLFRYSHAKMSILIPLSTLLANSIYHFTIADFIGSAFYCKNYLFDPRFLIGIFLFITGLVINWSADIQLMLLRSSRHDKDYVLPQGVLFSLISCPNYFGECLEWLGWAIASWSLSGLVWWLYTVSCLVTRAKHNHNWYKDQFTNYPYRRTAIIPFLY